MGTVCAAKRPFCLLYLHPPSPSPLLTFSFSHILALVWQGPLDLVVDVVILTIPPSHFFLPLVGIINPPLVCISDMSSPLIQQAASPSSLPSTSSLAPSPPPRSPYLDAAKSRITRRHPPPPQRLLLLQPDGLAHRLSSDRLVQEIAEARRISRNISSLSLKAGLHGGHHIEAKQGPLGGYDTRSAQMARRRRAASQSAALSPSRRPALFRRQHQRTSSSSSAATETYLVDYYDDSSPEFTPLFTPPAERRAPSKKRNSRRSQSASATSYPFPLPPHSSDDGHSEQEGVHFGGLGLDLGPNWNELIDRPDAIESPCPAQACYDSDGLTGSQGWSPDTTAFDTGSNMASPFVDDISLGGFAGHVQPLSIRKASTMRRASSDDETYLEPFSIDAEAADETEKLARLSNSLSLLSMDAETEHEEATAFIQEAEAGSAMSPSVVRAIYSPERAAPSLAEQLAFACGNGYQYRGSTPAVGMARVVSSSAEGYLPRQSNGSSPAMSLCLDPLSGLRAEVGDSWSDAHGHGSDRQSRCWDEDDREEDSFWVRRESIAEEGSNDASVVIDDDDDDVASMGMRSAPAKSRQVSLFLPSPTMVSSPILSGVLSSTPPNNSAPTDFQALAAAHKEIRVEQLFRQPFAESDTSPESPSIEEVPSRQERAASPTVNELQQLPTASPDMHFFGQEFGSYLSLMDAGSPKSDDINEARTNGCRRSPRPPPITLPKSTLSPTMDAEASFDLSSFKTPEPLSDLPSPTATDGERPFPFAGVRPSIDIVDSRTALPASFSMMNTPAHPHQSICSAVSMAVTQSRATEMTASTSTSSVLDRGRPIPASASCGFLGRNRDENIRLARAQAAATLEGTPATAGPKSRVTGPLTEEAIAKSQMPRIPKRSTSMGRLRIESQSEVSPSKDAAALPTPPLPHSSEAEAIRRVWWQQQMEQREASPTSIRPVLAPSASMPASLIPGHPHSSDAPKRPSISSSATTSSSFIERSRSPRPRALSRGASEALKKELAASTRPRGLPASQSMVCLPTTRAPHTPAKKVASMPPIQKETAPLPLPTLFIARTHSQRLRGDTGIAETNPRLIAKATRARREVSNGILLHSTMRAAPTASPVPAQRIRWASVEAAGRGSMDSQSSKMQTPSGVILVVEEKSVTIA
ncbi:hypothetical protein BDZ90DRAFT_144210 [Jaminaea rosea]|uniref:Uncharacterized protein n=1 Tax=Jaminaea rosea TaxID=1569628 RepID=A0A316UWI4_9BASI|nr:hypothetical protein BDZ90DRAFT_144210 [Jaminaea rosea]PWN28283.1 hypothetical protein BDZ90DRAFT_144210 [Jaminaea rosea]